MKPNRETEQGNRSSPSTPSQSKASENVKLLDKLSSNRHLFVEPLLVTLVFGVSTLMWYYAVETPVLLHLFYVPVVSDWGTARTLSCSCDGAALHFVVLDYLLHAKPG